MRPFQSRGRGRGQSAMSRDVGVMEVWENTSRLLYQTNFNKKREEGGKEEGENRAPAGGEKEGFKMKQALTQAVIRTVLGSRLPTQLIIALGSFPGARKLCAQASNSKGLKVRPSTSSPKEMTGLITGKP